MHRKKPFSGKQKKQQMKEKRNRKKDGPRYLQDDSDDDDEGEREERHLSSQTHDNGNGAASAINSPRAGGGDLPEIQKINLQPQKDHDLSKLDANSFRLHFFKESDEVVKKKRKEARKPVRPVQGEHLVYKTEDVYPPKAVLDFPKRPPWNYSLTKERLEQQERQYFSSYVSEIINQPRAQDLSYFELNLETWRQLWRVLEISDILLVIADIRYPVLHVPPSLLTHILHELKKEVIIVLNKADFAPPMLALSWKRYLHSTFPGIQVVFFTSFPREALEEEVPVDFDPTTSVYKRPHQTKLSTAVGPAQLLKICKDIVQDKVDLSSWEEKISVNDSHPPHESDGLQSRDQHMSHDQKTEQPGAASQGEDSQLEDSSQSHASHYPSRPRYKDGVVTIGCIGYPNSGKSSVMNSLVGKKVVSVSKTPGHTKHLQTIFLTPTVKLCDCPGLVFPSMVPKSLQIIAGIFPVAQVREPYSVVGYLAKRLDLPKLLRLQPLSYTKPARGKEENFVWSALDICEAWAIKCGFRTSKAGRPDGFRAANKILRLAVEGQLCLCFKPPNYSQMIEQLATDPELQEVAALLHTKLSSQEKRDSKMYEEENSDDDDEEQEEAEVNMEDSSEEETDKVGNDVEADNEREEDRNDVAESSTQLQDLDFNAEGT